MLLLGAFILINSRISRLSENFLQISRGYSSESGETRLSVDRINQNLMLLNQDANTLRELMNLSPREYPTIGDSVETAVEENSEGQETVLFFKSIDKIIEVREKEKDSLFFQELISNLSFQDELSSRTLKSVQAGSNGKRVNLEGPEGFEFCIEYSGDRFTVSSISGKNLEADELNSIWNFIDENITDVREIYRLQSQAFQRLNALKDDKALIDFLKSKELEWGDVKWDSGGIELNVYTADENIAAGFHYEKVPKQYIFTNTFSGERNSFPGEQGISTAVKKALVDALTSYDPRAPGEIAEEESRTTLLSLHEDTGFLAYLNSVQTSLAETFREDHYYSYLDLSDSQGDLIGSMAVQKHTGEIYLMDKDDIVITSLKTLGLGAGIRVEKTISIPKDFATSSPIIFGEKDIAFVLIGANEANTDTMMVVHLNELNGKGTIITIPRDLYYNGRKINSYYPTFGPVKLMQIISEITGLPVKRYMFIDMFAFADVVDILGGVDIVLNEPLVDPTYRIKENGKWSTLHYEAGPLHLGGVEALRVARSRHSSSDFGRAERQLTLLMALKDKLAGLNAGDSGRLVEIAETLNNYVQTDFSIIEIINLFTRYRDSPFSQHVLSWDNVLYDTYSNMYMLEPGTEVEDNFYKGAWILLPENNDWDVIKWYIRKVISEE